MPEQAGSFEILNWDSSFFGFKVAKILTPILNSEQLGGILTALRSLDVSLVYWPADGQAEGSREAADRWGGFLADEKRTYVASLSGSGEMIGAFPEALELYREKKVTDDLRKLALLSGSYSRFKLDPKFPREIFERLYDAWIEKSVQGADSEAVWVYRTEGKIAGMLTVGPRTGRANIGLVAVAPEFAGRGIGTRLIQASKKWSLQNGFSVGQVVTQGENRPACALYEKSGYTLEKTERFYHFWLKEV